MQRIEQIVSANPNVETVFASAGSSGVTRGFSSSSIANRGSVTVKLKEERNTRTLDVIDDLRRQLASVPGAKARLTQTDIVSRIMTGGSQNIEIDIFGDDLGTLSHLAKEVMSRVRDVPGLENVDMNWQEAHAGDPVEGGSAEGAAAGRELLRRRQHDQHGHQRTHRQLLPGEGVPVSDHRPDAGVTPQDRRGDEEPDRDFEFGRRRSRWHPAEPGRRSRATAWGRARSRDTTASATSPSPACRRAGRRARSRRTFRRRSRICAMPRATTGTGAPDQKRQAEEFGGLWLAVFLAIALIYMLLASQFESFIHPLTILFSVPLAISGVILALFLTGRSFGLTAFIGVLMLVGIVVKNGILLVDYTNTLRGRGIDREEALLRAGPTRLRPILMTASAAVLGMLPIALGLGKGSEVQAPMATAVIGGLMTSTVLTLFVVPTVYTALDDAVLFFRRRKETGNDR